MKKLALTVAMSALLSACGENTALDPVQKPGPPPLVIKTEAQKISAPIQTPAPAQKSAPEPVAPPTPVAAQAVATPEPVAPSVPTVTQPVTTVTQPVTTVKAPPVAAVPKVVAEQPMGVERRLLAAPKKAPPRPVKKPAPPVPHPVAVADERPLPVAGERSSIAPPSHYEEMPAVLPIYERYALELLSGKESTLPQLTENISEFAVFYSAGVFAEVTADMPRRGKAQYRVAYLQGTPVDVYNHLHDRATDYFRAHAKNGVLTADFAHKNIKGQLGRLHLNAHIDGNALSQDDRDAAVKGNFIGPRARWVGGAGFERAGQTLTIFGSNPIRKK